jgi:transposase-like protein
MKAYAISIDGIIQTKAPTNLKDVAKRSGINESSLYKGRRVFIKDGVVIRIHELNVIKAKRK